MRPWASAPENWVLERSSLPTVPFALPFDLVRLARIRAPSAWVTRTAGMVTAGLEPPRPVNAPGALSATITPTAPAFWAFMVLIVKSQEPRLTRAILLRTAAALAALNGVQAEPGLSDCRATAAIWPVSGESPSFGPKSASPTANTSVGSDLAPAPTIRSCAVAFRTDGTDAVTRAPVHDRPLGLSADAARSALVMSTHSLPVVLSSRKWSQADG